MEMLSDSVCRLCLTVEADNKMLSLTPVQELYEKVTNNRLHTNKMPVTVCYICYAQLKRCYKFMVKSTIAENTLIEILNIQTAITPKLLCTINCDAKGLTNTLTMTPVLHNNFPLNLNVPALVKSELIEQEEIDIKGEVEGSSNATIIPQSSRDGQVSVPSEVVKTEQRSHKGVPNGMERFEDKTTAIKRMQSLEFIVIENSGHYLCRFCETSFNHRKGIVTHLRVHKPYVCAVCQLQFDWPSYLRRHIKVHIGDRPHACNLCEKRFTTATHLKQHLVSHLREKLYECDICNAKFTNKSGIIKHIKIHTSALAGSLSHECDLCHRKFTNKFNLKIHFKLHAGEKPFECKICNYSFDQKSNLNRHLKTHTAEKPFECNICSRGFREKSYLFKHVTTHTGEKPFECQVCYRSFREKRNLVQHSKMHTDKTFECKICNRSFHLKSSFNRHLRTHTAEKPFECKICSRGFRDKSYLFKHVRTHTGSHTG